jgi:nucleoid-associated protein YgaU
MAGVQLEQQKPDSGGGFGIGFSARASFSAGASAGFSAQTSVNAGIAAGTTPLTLTQAGDTVQGLTSRAGLSASWKAVASANNIDNPRKVDPGTVLNLNVNVSP